MFNLGSVTNSDIGSLKPGTPPHSISRTYFCVIGRWGYEAPYSSMSPVFPIIQQLFRGLLGNMLLSAVPTSIKGHTHESLGGLPGRTGWLALAMSFPGATMVWPADGAHSSQRLRMYIRLERYRHVRVTTPGTASASS
jgi:hypothetical protein